MDTLKSCMDATRCMYIRNKIVSEKRLANNFICYVNIVAIHKGSLMSTHKSINANTIYTYGRSSVALGGNVTDTNRTAVAFTSMSVDAQGGGPTMVTGTNVRHSLSSTGTAPYWNPSYVGMNVSTAINGTASTVLTIPGNVVTRPIPYSTGVAFAHISSWNYLTGAATTSGVNYSFGRDDAATPTRAVPGELIYGETGGVPTSGEYSAKTT